MGVYQDVRFLRPKQVRFRREVEGQLAVEVDGQVYTAVKPYKVAPLSLPDKMVSLRVGEGKSDQKEIGIIADLNELSEDDRALIEEELQKRYLVKKILAVLSIRSRYGYLYWEVETEHGPESFALAEWMHDNIRDNGRGGKLIVDLQGGRYEIERLADLDRKSRVIFSKFIYW